LIQLNIKLPPAQQALVVLLLIQVRVLEVFVVLAPLADFVDLLPVSVSHNKLFMPEW